MGVVLKFAQNSLAKYLLVVVFIGVSFFGALDSAQGQVPGQAGVSVSPALIELDRSVDPGTTESFSVTVKNLNATSQTFYLSARNIIDVREGGVPVFSDNPEKTGLELADWITLPVSQITLEPGASQQVNFTLAVPTEASPGSHFGSVFISVDPPEIQNSGAAVGYQVANIIIIRVTGDAQLNANIRQLSTDRFFNGGKDVDFTARIENNGNVFVRPIGPVEITNMLGQQVDSFVFNEERAGVFPSKVREYTFNWKGEGTGFGRYEAILSATYGDDGAKKTLSSTVSFWILPLNIIGPALAALALLLLITFVFVKLYIRRTLAHLSYSQSRIVHKRRKSGTSGTLLLMVVMLIVTVIFMLILLAVFA
ncbi:MAG: DUF916 domain-containing protein [Patescibacteria group bacterium]